MYQLVNGYIGLMAASFPSYRAAVVCALACALHTFIR